MAIILLENVRSVLNVGGVFRIADAVGAEKILLVGYTPAPVDRMGREHGNIAKTALGAERSVVWQQYATVADALAIHPDHTPVIVEQTPASIPYTEHTPPTHPLYIFGNEVEGVSPTARRAVSTHIQIPMRGMKESLNITVAVAVILYHHLACKQI